ncbi:MAG: hypothetical protein ACJ8J0_18165 [Longimicrobiaceae bacterium]
MFCLGPDEGAYDDLSWLVYSPWWSADVVPLDEPWRGNEPARAMLVVIGEGSVVLRKLFPVAAVAEADRAARVIADAVHRVARKAGGYPRRVLVREWAAATLLGAELDSHGVDVRVSALRKTARIVRDLARLLDRPDAAWDLAPVREWSDVGPAALDEYFRSAARFWRARPWKLADDEEAFLARRGTREAVVVLTHPRGHGHAVTVYTSASDYPEDCDPAHPVFGLQFTSRARRARLLDFDFDLPVTPAHPDPQPYPLLLESRDSHGPSTPQLALVSALLSALAALGESRTRVSRGLRFMAENGVELRIEREARRPRWPAMKRARPGCAAGAAADPAAAAGSASGLKRAEQERVGRFTAHLEATRPRPWAAARHVRHAAEWTRDLAGTARTSAAAATEYDLRTFLYDWYPRTTRDDDDATRAVAASLRRYFAFLAEREGIAYPWAAAVLRERTVFLDRLETAPLSRNRDETRAWLAPLHEDLDARVMLPDRGFPGRHTGFDPPASPEVAALAQELLRHWQVWRDEAIREGHVAPAALRAQLVARQRAWERTLHPRFGRSPLRVWAEAEDRAPTR